MKLQSMLRNALIRVLAVTLTVGVAAAVFGYIHEKEASEDASIRMLEIEVRRAVPAAALELPSPEREQALAQAIKNMVGGIFSVAEVYSATGRKMAEAVPSVAVIASGGVGKPQDILDLAATGTVGVIVGKAIYTGNVDLAAAIAALAAHTA